jgi:tRNA A-37 threonylcarbamoyl transferase component Bud32
MAADPSRCPSPGVLEGLLAERLSGPERDSVETHVECCAPCQEHLARLSDRTLRAVAPPFGCRDEPEPEPDEAFLLRLRAVPPPSVSHRHGPPPSAADEPPPFAAGPAPESAWFENGRLGRYEVLGKLAAGGMGAVFKARHAELGKVVALKVLPAGEMDEVRVARFRNEIRAIGRLNHPNIVAAHDAGELGGVHFLVMDFVEGLDLARVLERHGRLSVPDACEAVRQAALGLQHAFERGLVHRDVKPSNLMLAPGGRVQVLDLGLARSFAEAAADTLTARGMLLGTADYLAPEQWEHAHAADTRADIYSLGCTLYHLLAGRPPFAGERYHSVLQKMRAHLETAPAPIAQLRPEVPAGLAAVLGRMLAKDPAGRFQSPAEVAEALRPFTAGSDLAALLGADAAASAPGGSPCATVPTPAPGLWETASDRTGRGRRLPVPRSPYAVRVSLAALCLLLVAAWVLWPGFGGSPTSAAKPLEIKEMHVTHYRAAGDKEKKENVFLGDLRKSSEPVRLNDKMGIAADLTAPAYYYLIAFNPKGSEAGTIQLCQPEDADGRALEGVRPERLTELQYSQYFIPDAVGLQAFVLAASTKPLPPFKEWRPEVPWEGVKDGGAWTWHFDGREFIRLPLDRGKVEPKGGVPESFRKLCEFFKGRSEFEAVQAIAFPVADEQK